jgi:hypothetical protein
MTSPNHPGGSILYAIPGVFGRHGRFPNAVIETPYGIKAIWGSRAKSGKIPYKAATFESDLSEERHG